MVANMAPDSTALTISTARSKPPKGISTPASLMAPAPTVEVTEPVPNSALTFGIGDQELRHDVLRFGRIEPGAEPSRP